MSLAELVGFIEALPHDSALHRKLGVDWSGDNELLALNAEVSFEVYRAVLALGGVKRHRIPPPLRVPRPSRSSSGPSAPPSRRRAKNVEEVMAVLAAGHRSVTR